MARQQYIISREIPGVGLRFLDSPEHPLRWVKDPDKAYRFEMNINDLAEQYSGEAVEVESW